MFINCRPVTEPRVKEKGANARPFIIILLTIGPSLSTRSFAGRASERAPPQKQLKKISESQQIEILKKVSLREKCQPVQLLDPEYPTFSVFTPKFVSNDGQSLLNSDHPSHDPKTTCNILNYLYTDAEVTTLVEKSDVDIEDSCTSKMYQVPVFYLCSYVLFPDTTFNFLIV